MTPKATAPRDGRRRIVLRYHASPQRILGEERATGVQLAAGTIDAGLVLTAIGYCGRPGPRTGG